MTHIPSGSCAQPWLGLELISNATEHRSTFMLKRSTDNDHQEERGAIRNREARTAFDVKVSVWQRSGN